MPSLSVPHPAPRRRSTPPSPALFRSPAQTLRFTAIGRLAGSTVLARILIATVAAGTLPMIFGASAASAAPGESATPGQGTPSQGQWQELDRVATRHSALGVFGLTDTVLMLPAETSATERARVQAEIPAGMKVTVKISKFTRAEADRVKQDVMSGSWNKSGEKLGLVADYDGQEDKVYVAVEGPRSATEPLLSRYPGKVEAGPGRMTPEMGRFADSVPFWGGGAIDGAVGSCTAGYAVIQKSDDAVRMVTAGHCNPLWAKFQTPDGKNVGTVVRRRKDLDAELVSGAQYGGRIWVGGTAGSTSSLRVENWSGWTYIGRKLCVSGRTTFNHCGHPVSANGVSVSYHAFGERNTLDSDAVYLMDRGGTDVCHCNGKLTAPGDSGAPVYVTTHSDVAVNHQAAVIMGHHHGSLYYKGANRMVNIKPGILLNDWNLRPMYASD